ncbi:MAG TPA: UDP-N-acetylglucosamine 2-epimerase (non-hydrolyzing), partial [Rubricoccaceae bacterium]|nr:UDP-N-acetylglucosamine 2-epimerase (non-hydrolyzing) [Rubricoccaceae bacterium]
MQRILHVVGARPNFMKVAPVVRAMARRPDAFAQTLVHTGQHYDPNMSAVFFEELGLPAPDVNLEVGSGSHARQTAEVMTRFEPVLLDFKPDWVVVPGDVNSTLACALVAAKLGVKVAHIEAGLRSFDRTMPEEINRLLTDQLADLLLTPSQDADENLRREGIAEEKIRFVGNAMIDTLVRLRPKAEARWPALREAFGLDRYLLVTLHRPGNVDAPDALAALAAALTEIGAFLPVLFPVHPRTRARLGAHTLGERVRLVEPVGYLDFLALQAHAAAVLTDSGGVQEETTYLGVPCLTVRPNTERPITITHGTNRLVERDRDVLVAAVREAIERGARGRGPSAPLQQAPYDALGGAAVPQRGRRGALARRPLHGLALGRHQ